MSETLSNFTQAQLEQIVAEIKQIRAAIIKPQPTGLILTTSEAIAYVKKDSKYGLYAWAKDYGVERSGNDRWPAHRLDAGLAKEARTKFSKAA